MFEIICIQDENREKFDLLCRMAIGWGLERVHFASTDMLGIIRVKKLGQDKVLVVIGEYATLTSDKKIRSNQCDEYVATLLEQGVSKDQIIILDGSESPEEIENIVRRRLFTLLNI